MKFAYVAETEALSPYAMSVVLVDEKDWRKVYDLFVSFRRNMKKEIGLDPAQPFDILPFARGSGEGSLSPGKGRNALSSFAQLLSALPVSIVSVVSKSGGEDRASLRRRAFPVVMQRVERAPDSSDGFRFTVVCDDDMEKDVRALSRKLRKYNPLPGGQNVPMTDMIEDTFVRDVNSSHLLKSAEFASFLACTYFLYRDGGEREGLLAEYGEIGREMIFRIFYVWSERGILMERASLSNKYGIVAIK